jgi:hypothetical protein
VSAYPWRLAILGLLTLFHLVTLGATATGEAAAVSSIEDSELPKRVTITEATQLQITDGTKAARIVLPKGAQVEVTGLEGNLLQVLFVKTAGQLDVGKTTALEQIEKIRSQKAQQQREVEAARQAEAERRKRWEQEEEAAKRDILVLSWQWRETSGGGYYEAVGEIMNESKRLLKNVQVEVTIRDAANNIVSTETGLASDKDLQPGQQTTFRAMVRRVGGEEKASLAFRELFGGRYTHREK